MQQPGPISYYGLGAARRFKMAKAAGVILFNRDRRKVFQATLYHSVVCKAAKTCFCQEVHEVTTTFTHRVEQSFRIPPRGHSIPLPPEALLIPQVKSAMKGPRPQLTETGAMAEVQHLGAGDKQPTKPAFTDGKFVWTDKK